MQVSRFTRWMGLLSVIGASIALSATMYWVAVKPDIESLGESIYLALWAVAYLLIQIGQVGIYRYHSPHRSVTKWIGFIYFVAMGIVTSLLVVQLSWMVYEGFTKPYAMESIFSDHGVVTSHNTFHTLLYIGWIIFGIYVAVKKGSPRWFGVVLAVGALLHMIPLEKMVAAGGVGAHIRGFDAAILIDLAFILLGWAVWRSKSPQVVAETEQLPVEETEQVPVEEEQ